MIFWYLFYVLGSTHTERQRQRCIGIHCDAWEWGRGSISKHHNVFQYNADADARCVYALYMYNRNSKLHRIGEIIHNLEI